MDKLKPCPNCENLKHPDFPCIRCYPLNPVFVRRPASNTNTDTALAAAEARFAELLAREQREAERRKKQGVILDHAMRGLRNSAEHPDDGRMQAVRALAKHSERQAGRILALEKALEPFAREEVESMYKDPWHLQFSDPDGFVDFTDFTIGDLRRAAALLKEKE